MNGPFERIDPQVVFVIVALVIGALQALWEKRRRARAERELQEDVERRAVERGRPAKPPAEPGSFRELYEEYRRQILTDQQRPPGQPESYTPPWQPPQSAAPPPLPSPPPIPATAKPVRAKPKPVDAAPERWAKEAPTAWQPPKIRRAQDVLSPQELAALAKLQQQSRQHPAARQAPQAQPLRRLLGSPDALRNAVLLREILGPPKGLSD